MVGSRGIGAPDHRRCVRAPRACDTAQCGLVGAPTKARYTNPEKLEDAIRGSRPSAGGTLCFAESDGAHRQAASEKGRLARLARGVEPQAYLSLHTYSTQRLGSPGDLSGPASPEGPESPLPSPQKESRNPSGSRLRLSPCPSVGAAPLPALTPSVGSPTDLPFPCVFGGRLNTSYHFLTNVPSHRVILPSVGGKLR